MDLNHPAPHGEQPREPGRVVELVAGDFLLTVNPIDGSEIESCPPGRRPIAPRRAPAPGPAAEETRHTPLLDREEQRHRLRRLLSRGRSVRLTGSPGAGRTALLAAVARDCAELAPDGVIRLNGHRRNATDLLHELFAAAHRTSAYRPGPTELSAALREIGAVVLIDDVEFGGAPLQEILDATPECAFVISATQDAPAPAADSRLEELALPGLSRTGCLELAELSLGRQLSEAETDWASDLWLQTEGLPRRFVQAAALLRGREAGEQAPLPESAALTASVAGLLTPRASEILRYAVALGGELPGRDRLAAFLQDPAAPEAYAELLGSGLLTQAGGGHRLAAGVVEELTEAGFAEGAPERARTATQHYTWWLADTVVAPERVAEEAGALVATVRAAQRAGLDAAVGGLARAAAPLLAASLRWSAWERMLRSGQESARSAGEVAQQAYFHHELGVLAICQGQLDRARAELEASTALRAVLADAVGAVAGRRALALVDDLSRPPAPPPAAFTPPLGIPPAASPAPPAPVPGPPGSEDATQLLGRAVAPEEETGTMAPVGRRGARRNVFAAGAGALLVAVLGTVVAFGLSSGGEEEPDGGTTPDPAATDADTPLTTDEDSPTEEETSASPSDSASPTESESPSDSNTSEAPEDPARPSGSPDQPTASASGEVGSDGGSGGGSGDGSDGGSHGGGSADGGTGDGGTSPGTSEGTSEGGDDGGSEGTDPGTSEGGSEGTDTGASEGTSEGTDEGTSEGTDTGTSEGTDAGGDAEGAGGTPTGATASATGSSPTATATGVGRA
ncbi:ATP-binding protein [Streptomyces hoynatensis]|uniref:ATP-binding protein n=1 Tax=Streptomyces hoynatensis TaxID=1141874 RepID=A0A3A9Z0K1_9ACTN|nr:ATP-binding protein [Streptomyces hoynatensis]RKN40897.1 ATP-binding protein [Streptomyces hoynatensis]